MKIIGMRQFLGLLLACVALTGCSRPEKILWNGESQNNGAGWVSPRPPDLSIETQDKIVHSGAQAVHFHCNAGYSWVEWGWRWFPFWPPAPGTDLRPYHTLTFAIKTSTPLAADDIKIRLDSAPGLLKSKMISIKAYDPHFSDGEWHVITIPLQDFNVEGMKYDPSRADELFFGSQAQHGAFDFYLDDIAVHR
jgi:hypothetical protein